MDSKKIESELLKALFSALDPELKANQLNVDPASVFYLPSSLVGGWKEIATQQTVKFPFTNGSKSFCIEIPIFDAEFQAQMALDLYGYKEASRILVVDDSTTTRKLSRNYLSMAGYLNLDEAVDGQAAFTKLQSSRPLFDLVVCDWHMPNLSGFDLLKKVRADATLAAVPFILATGERNAEEVTMAIKAGVSGYVMKPYDAATLYGAMKKAATPRQLKKAA